jgi:hypothetical protein
MAANIICIVAGLVLAGIGSGIAVNAFDPSNAVAGTVLGALGTFLLAVGLAVRAALARRFPDAGAEQREALLRRVEDSFRSPAS